MATVVIETSGKSLCLGNNFEDIHIHDGPIKITIRKKKRQLPKNWIVDISYFEDAPATPFNSLRVQFRYGALLELIKGIEND